jgi:hypothetical protein
MVTDHAPSNWKHKELSYMTCTQDTVLQLYACICLATEKDEKMKSYIRLFTLPLQPRLLRNHHRRVRETFDAVPRNLVYALEASNVHQDIKIRQQALHHMSDA